ncbi:MAG: Ig-like domain-containing protein, partial [Verrucomicrobiales bacterium]|nr:Ig-like domain-containing protein [Verrucomicrobiales bacterium]
VVEYSISDNDGATSSANITFVVTGINDNPVAVDDPLTIDEDTSITVDLLSNDSDAESDPLSVIEINGNPVAAGIPVTLPSGGEVTLQADGTVSYDPNGQFEGLGAGELATDIFTYTVDDGNGGSDVATVTVDINGVNDGPLIENNTLTLEEGETIPITGSEISASDPDHGPIDLTFTVSNPAGGQFLLNGVPVTTFTQQDINDGLVAYEDDGTETPPSYDLTVTDPGNLSDQSPLDLNYTPVNDAPEAVDDADSTNEDSAVDVDLTGNDTDAESDPITVSKLEGNFAGVGVPISLASGATVMSLGNGEVRYNPNQSFEGLIDGQTATDTFTYEISDGNGATDIATVTMTINGVNDGPTIETNTLTLSEGDTIPVTTAEINATDPDHGSADLTFAVTNPVGGQFLLNGTPSVSFTLKDIEDGLVQYQDDGTETPPSYDLTVTDPGNLSDQSPLDLNYTPVNDTPEAVDDSGSTDQNTIENIDILSNDTDPEDQSLSVSEVNQQPVAVGIPSVIASGATVTLQPNGTFNYDPNGQFDYLSSTESAVDTFTYVASDGNGGTDIATVSVTVNGLNDTPDALNDGFNVDENGTANYDLRTNDTDPDGDNLTVSQINGATIGTEGSLTLPSGAVVTLNVDGTVNYNPNDQFELPVGQTAIDTFTYQVSDGNGGYDTATTTVTIDGINDAPVANEDFSLGNTPGRPVVFNVAANDTDIDGTVNPATVDLDPTSPGITTTLTVEGEGTWESNGLGQVIFTPDENLLGNPGPLSYSIQDNDGLTSSSNGSLTVTYANFDLWFGNDLSGSVSSSEFEQSRVLISGMADLLPFNESNGAKAGLFSWSASGDGALNQGITADDDLFVNTALTYSRPFSGGTNIDYAINYGVQQILASLEPGGGGRDYADQILLILTDASPSDQIISPQAQIIAAADAAKALGIQIGFIAIQEAQSSQAALDVLAQAASLDASGQPILMTAPTYAGIDQAQIINAIAGLAPEHAYNIVNQPILAIGDAEIVAENGTVDIDPLDNDNHVSNDTLTITEINTVPISPGNSITLSSGAVVSMNVDGSLTYDTNGQFSALNNGDAQADIFEYTVIDESGNSETGSIGVTVEGVSAVPPIVIDMDGDGAEFDGIEEGISLDVDGDGVSEQTAWASEDDAVLIFDENSNNAVDGPGEFAFSTYSSDPDATDLEGLAHFDSDGDGTLDVDDENFAKFKIWQDSDGDGEASEGEMTSLLEAGIQSIELTSDQNEYTSADGDVFVHGEAQIIYQDGSTGIAADAEFNFEEIIESDDSGFEVLTESGSSINVEDSLPSTSTVCAEGDIVAPPCLAVDDLDLL